MLDGEISYRKAVIDKADAATFDAAFDKIKAAVSLSENLKYDTSNCATPTAICAT